LLEISLHYIMYFKTAHCHVIPRNSLIKNSLNPDIVLNIRNILYLCPQEALWSNKGSGQGDLCASGT
jgi:hypothetical protein